MSYDDKQAEALIVYLEAENIDYLKLREMLAALRAARPVERRVEGWALWDKAGEVLTATNDAELHDAYAREGISMELCTITLHDAAREEEGR